MSIESGQVQKGRTIGVRLVVGNPQLPVSVFPYGFRSTTPDNLATKKVQISSKSIHTITFQQKCPKQMLCSHPPANQYRKTKKPPRNQGTPLALTSTRPPITGTVGRAATGYILSTQEDKHEEAEQAGDRSIEHQSLRNTTVIKNMLIWFTDQVLYQPCI